MPLIDLANPPQDLAQLSADPFGSSPGPGAIFPNSYDFAKRFVQTPTTFENGGNGITSIDDPTYLGFNIMFDVASPLFNGADTGTPPPPNAAGSTDGNSTTQIPKTESAVGYLTTRGDTTRAAYLQSFIQGLKQIERTRPYYFQTIDGIQPAFAKTVDMLDPYGGVAANEGITIGMLEAMDLKMSALFNLYKMAAFDVKHKRQIIPRNLLHFNVTIDIIEIRKFKTVRNIIRAGQQEDFSDEGTISVANENASKISFLFSECTFDPAASGKVFENVSNVGDNGNVAASEMKWQYGKVEMAAQFAGFGSKLTDARPLTTVNQTGKMNEAVKKFDKDKLKANVQSKLKGIADNAVKGAKNFAERTVRSAVSGTILGNVFGGRNEFVNAVTNPQGLINSLNGAALTQLAGQTAQGINQSIDDNIFAGQIPSPGGDSLSGNSNIFGPGPSGPGPFDGGNIFE